MKERKFYAVKNGRKTGIYRTWDECKAQTNGFPDSQFKSFLTEEDALRYLTGASIDKCFAKVNPIVARGDIELKDGECVAYVDGSFNAKKNRYGWGLVFITDYDATPDQTFGGGDIPELAQMRNIAGELIGAAKAIEKAIELGFKKIYIYHDYTGIAKWAEGDWRANKPYTQRYADFAKKAMNQIEISFQWVKGHSNDLYNDMADELAKKGAK